MCQIPKNYNVRGKIPGGYIWNGLIGMELKDAERTGAAFTGKQKG
jgi:hypothetical protein